MRGRQYRITLTGKDGTETGLTVLIRRGRIIGVLGITGAISAMVTPVTEPLPVNAGVTRLDLAATDPELWGWKGAPKS